MKKLIILSTTILLAFGQYVAAQPPKIQEILQRLPDKVIPYKGEKHDLRDKGATGVYHADGKLDDRLYTNVHLLKITFGGVTDWRTDVLLSVTPEGEILDQMPVAVMVYGSNDIIPVMQYEITSDAKVIVYRLEPVSKVSIPLSDFASFTANRVDRTYEINSDGKYVLVDTKRYKVKTYTLEMLQDEDYNIYSGNEIPM